MKLWMVVYALGLVGGSAGPLPYDMAECERRAEAIMAACKPNPAAKKYTCEDLVFRCEWRAERPAIDQRLKSK